MRVQLNLKVRQAPNIHTVAKFRDFMFPIMWLEEVKFCNFLTLITSFIFDFFPPQGISELTPPIRRWIYLGTVFAPTAIPIMSYGMIVGGAFIIIFVFIQAYKNFVFSTDPTIEILEMGRRSLRRGSSLLINGQHRLSHLAHQRDSYHLLKTPKSHHTPAKHHITSNMKPMSTINSNNSSNDEEDSPSS